METSQERFLVTTLICYLIVLQAHLALFICEHLRN